MKAEQYREIRERLEMTQGELAAALGIQRNTVTRREIETAPISREAEFAIQFLAMQRSMAPARRRRAS